MCVLAHLGSSTNIRPPYARLLSDQILLRDWPVCVALCLDVTICDVSVAAEDSARDIAAGKTSLIALMILICVRTEKMNFFFFHVKVDKNFDL